MAFESSYLPRVAQRFAVVRIQEFPEHRPKVSLRGVAFAILRIDADPDVHARIGLRKHPSVERRETPVENHVQSSRRQIGAFPPPHQGGDLATRAWISRKHRVRTVREENEPRSPLFTIETPHS